MNEIKSSEHGSSSRRTFIKDLTFGACGLIIIGNYGFALPSLNKSGKIKAIIIDYSKCTGCRTCETVCSATNHPVMIGNEELKGAGNPYLSNIKVYHYNPDVDIAVTCWLCPDAPCIKACIVSPGLFTRRKALYRDPVTAAIKNDADRCQECGQCALACKTNRSGVIKPSPETNRPERMCTLCNGDPACVKYCTYGALSFQEVNINNEYFGLSPQKIAEELYKKLYLN